MLIALTFPVFLSTVNFLKWSGLVERSWLTANPRETLNGRDGDSVSKREHPVTLLCLANLLHDDILDTPTKKTVAGEILKVVDRPPWPRHGRQCQTRHSWNTPLRDRWSGA